MTAPVHALKSADRGSKAPFFVTATTKCGLTLPPVHTSEVRESASAWNSDVTCPGCRSQ